MDLNHIMLQSTLNFFHGFIRNTVTATHIHLLHSPTNYTNPAANVPIRNLNIIAETAKSFRRFSRITIKGLKRGIISETGRTIDMHFRNELASFKKKYKKLIAMPHETSEICVENLQKNNTQT